MLETLVFIGVFIILGQMWSRLQTAERRLAALEGTTTPEWTEPSWTPPAPVAEPPEGAPQATWWDEVPVQPAPPPIIEQPTPAPLPEPVPEPAAETEPARAGFGFEELFGRRLPIWAGGVTLAVAGVFIVRYTIEAGLLSPPVRVIAGLIFGSGLIVAADIARRFEDRVRDPRVCQALAGAGVATLYASVLVAANLYFLIGPATAFFALAAVTALAMLLSLRFGAPSALLGLVGGLAAPALVDAGPPNVPLLTLYLALAVGGLSVLSHVQRWMWLGASALVGGLGWGLLLVLGGMIDAADSLSIGFYLLVVGVVFPLFALPDANSGRLMRIGGTIAAAAQMATLVATGGFSLLNWGLFGLISVAIIWLSRREEAFRRLPTAGLTLALLLIGLWPAPALGEFALVTIAAAIIFGGPALHALWRPGGGLAEVGEIVAIALGTTFLAAIHFYRADHSADAGLALVALAAALLPATAAALGWATAGRKADPRFALLVATFATLIATAAGFVVPIAWLGPVIAGLGVALLLFSQVAEDVRIEAPAWVAVVLAVPVLAAAPNATAEFGRALGMPAITDAGTALLRWASLSVAAGLFAWRSCHPDARSAAQAVAALLAYVAMAQLVSAEVLPIATAAMLLGVALISRLRAADRLLPTLTSLLFVVLAWAALPLGEWAIPVLASTVGDPPFVGDLPAIGDVVRRLLIPGFLVAAATWAAWHQIGREARAGGAVAAAALGAVSAHVLFKQVIAIDSVTAFVAYGFAERTLWEVLLLGVAYGAWKLGARQVALAVTGAACAHLGWYSLVLYNPLWYDQAVGPAPIFNLLLVAYGLPLALLALAPRLVELDSTAQRGRAVAQMLLIVLLGYSLLRHAVHGPILTAPGLSEVEDIARSILAVTLAIGFLLRGIHIGSRTWRIGSLVLMLAAVAKVFLFDASGLEGLLRIASFVALGFSLIGIGWLYSRSLSSAAPLTTAR